MNERGKFLVLEGPDGGGKSSQVLLLSKWLKEEWSIENIPTKEHWDSDVLGQAIHTVVELKMGELDPVALQLTFLANRVNHTAALIEPSLARGLWVLGDRYRESTIAYTPDEYRDLLIRLTKDLEIRDKILRPDLSILVDVPADVAIRRGEARRAGIRPKNLPPELLLNAIDGSKIGRESIFEKEEKQKRVRQNYLERFNGSDRRMVIIDGVGDIEEVQERIRREIRRRKIV